MSDNQTFKLLFYRRRELMWKLLYMENEWWGGLVVGGLENIINEVHSSRYVCHIVICGSPCVVVNDIKQCGSFWVLQKSSASFYFQNIIQKLFMILPAVRFSICLFGDFLCHFSGGLFSFPKKCFKKTQTQKQNKKHTVAMHALICQTTFVIGNTREGRM